MRKPMIIPKGTNQIFLGHPRLGKQPCYNDDLNDRSNKGIFELSIEFKSLVTSPLD